MNTKINQNTEQISGISLLINLFLKCNLFIFSSIFRKPHSLPFMYRQLRLNKIILLFLLFISQQVYTKNVLDPEVKNGISPQPMFLKTVNIFGKLSEESSVVINVETDSIVVAGIVCNLSGRINASHHCNSADGASALVSIFSGNQPYVYNWSQISNVGLCNPGWTVYQDSIIINCESGVYQCIVTDSLGCIDTLSTTLVSEPGYEIASNTYIYDETCLGACDGAITLLQAFSVSCCIVTDVLWSNGSTDLEPNALCAGSYTGTITWGMGHCSQVYTHIIDSPSPPSIQVTIDTMHCGFCDGSIRLNQIFPGGTINNYVLGFDWFNQFGYLGSDSVLYGVCDGLSYTIGISYDCAGIPSYVSYNFTIPCDTTTVPCIMKANADYSSLCNGSCYGEINISITDVNGPVQYDWTNSVIDTSICNPSLGNTPNLNGMPPGNYQCIVTDALGCVDSVTVNLAASSNFSVSGNTQMEGCDSCNGFVNLFPIGGFSPYTFEWDSTSWHFNFGNNQYDQQNLYSVCLKGSLISCTILDSIGCLSYYSETFPVYCFPDVWGVQTYHSCPNQNDGGYNMGPSAFSYADCHEYSGYFTPIPLGGQANYNDFPDVSLGNISAGDYHYIMITNDGCDSFDVLFTIPEISINVVTTNPTCGICNGSAMILVDGDTINNLTNGWVVWSNDSSGLFPSVNTTICQGQMINYDLGSVCNVIDSFLLDSCDLIQNVYSTAGNEIHLQVTPNPNSGKFSIQGIKPGNSEAILEIFNTQGSRIYIKKFPSGSSDFQVEFKNGFPGIYLCRINKEGSIQLVRFIVE